MHENKIFYLILIIHLCTYSGNQQKLFLKQFTVASIKSALFRIDISLPRFIIRILNKKVQLFIL